MIWDKRGLLLSVDKDSDWSWSHCHKPTPVLLGKDRIRVYFGVRSKTGITRTTFADFEVLPDFDLTLLYRHDKPCFDIGKLGAFDDSGANVSCVINEGSLLYMYYIGWNPSTTVHTRNSIGIAKSTNGGVSFNRIFDGPIIDRNHIEPYYTGAVEVIRSDSNDDARFWVYYTSGTEWILVDGKPEIKYHIKFGHSKDGIVWIRDNQDAILSENPDECVARPSVVRHNNRFLMWYSRRSISRFRTDMSRGYRAGFAYSNDGLNWNRCDDKSGIEPSSTGWDSEAIAYPYVIRYKDAYIMFYNGNGFGRTGFGYAVAPVSAFD